MYTGKSGLRVTVLCALLSDEGINTEPEVRQADGCGIFTVNTIRRLKNLKALRKCKPSSTELNSQQHLLPSNKFLPLKVKNSFCVSSYFSFLPDCSNSVCFGPLLNVNFKSRSLVQVTCWHHMICRAGWLWLCHNLYQIIPIRPHYVNEFMRNGKKNKKKKHKRRPGPL